MTTGIRLDPSSDRPLYQQLIDAISDRVSSGILAPGSRLPASRTLATELGTHRNTIVRALSELVETGILTSTVGRGTFVAERLSAPNAPPARADLPWSSLLARTPETGSLQRSERLARGVVRRPDLIEMQRLQPPADLLPVAPLRRCIDHTLRTLGASTLSYGPRSGLPRLQRAIVADLARLGVPATAEDVLITTGSQQALDMLARALIDPGDTFLVEESTYSGAIDVFAASGARLVSVPADDEGPSLAALRGLGRAGAKGFYVMPNGRNPTGSTISLRRRQELVDWAHEAGVPLIEDDFCADLLLDGPALPSLRTLDAQVAHVGTFSKRLIPALRIGYVVAPAALRPHLVALKRSMDLSTSLLLQHALAEFLERGYLRAHLRRSLPAYRERRDALVTALREHLPPGVEFDVPGQGLALWLRLPRGLDPEACFTAAHERGVLVSPHTQFALDDRRPGLRVTYCAESPERLALGAKRLGDALRAQLERDPHPAEPELGAV